MKKTILITGSSSGFGKVIAKTLALAGHKVFATMRGVEGRNKDVASKLEVWASKNNADLEVVEMDILNDHSVNNAVS